MDVGCCIIGLCALLVLPRSNGSNLMMTSVGGGLCGGAGGGSDGGAGWRPAGASGATVGAACQLRDIIG